MDNKRTYEPPSYTPLVGDGEAQEHEEAAVPPQQEYPRYSQGYPPQQSYQAQGQGYPQGAYQAPGGQGYSQGGQGGFQPQGQGYPQYEQQQQYDYGQPAAVVVGVSGDEPQIHVSEQFSEQLSKLPRRMLQAITKPHVGNYVELKAYATMEMTIFMLLLIIVWAVIIELIGFGISGEHGAGLAILAAIFGTLIFFFLSNLLFHGVAMCLGGGAHHVNKTSLFIQLCYLSLLFSLPLDLLGILTWIPIFGFIVAFALFVYKLVLTVITLRAIYGVDTGHAIGILVVYIIAVIIVVVCFWTLVGSAWALVLLRAA